MVVQGVEQEYEHFLALQEISSRVSSIFDLDRMLDELVQRVMAAFGYYNVLIFLTSDEGEELYLAVSGRSLAQDEAGRRLRIGSEGLVGRSASAEISLVVPDIGECDFCAGSTPVVRSKMAIPLLVGGLLVGVIDVESDHVEAFQDRDVQLMTTLANQVAASIEAIRLLRESRANAMALEQRARTLMLINRISTTLTSSLNAAEILDRTVRHTIDLNNADYGGVFVLEQNKRSGVVLAEYPMCHLADRRFPYPDMPSIQRKLDMGIPCAIRDATNHPFLEPFREQLAPLDIRSLLLVPLMTRGDTIGILFLASRGRPRTFSEEEMEICQTIAGQAAAAVANARLVQDIRQQRRALARKTQELMEESGKLDAILSNISDGLVVTDNTGRIILSNPVFREMAGLPPDRSLRGFLLAGCFPVADLQAVVAQVLADPARVFTTNLEMPDGRVLKASAAAMHLRPTLLAPTQEERVAGVATILRDITHEVEVDRIKTDFVSAVSHELRSPLTAILGFASLIKRDIRRSIVPHAGDGETSRIVERILDNLAIIENESQRLTQLVNDLLDISKIEGGHTEWHMAETDLEKVINDAVATAAALADEQRLAVQVYLPPAGLPPIQGSYDRLIQVMTNLLSNAIKFTARGHIQVYGWQLDASHGSFEVGGPHPSIYDPDSIAQNTPADLKHKKWVIVSVSDTGVGIPAQSLPRIFEKFTQAGETLTEKPRGTGLGLAICKGIVEHHQGLIWVNSVQGEGSTFSFALPLTPEGKSDMLIEE